MFNLEKAITAWRGRFGQRRGFLCEDLDELERHLRDSVAEAIKAGQPEREAFWQAVRDVGGDEDAEQEYEKVYWGKLRRTQTRRDELANRIAMLKNYVVIALRNLRRHMGYTALNIGGLAVGLAVCLVIGLFVRHKLSFDRHLPNADRAYRIVQAPNRAAYTPPGLAPAIQGVFPEVEHLTNLSHPGRALFLKEDGSAHWMDAVVPVDSAFLKVFPYSVLAGAPDPLRVPDALVLTAAEARRLYGGIDEAVGQTLVFEPEKADQSYTVTAVISDPPPTIHFPIRALRSYGSKTQPGEAIRWSFSGGFTYLTLHPEVDAAAFTANLTAWEAKHRPAEGWESQPRFALQAVPRIHLWSDMNSEVAPQSHYRMLYLFGAIAGVILLLACINYMNLATARSARRAREVGVRKVVGAQRWQLVGQFLSESILLVACALPVGLALAALGVPWLERVASETMGVPLVDGTVLPVLLAVVLGVGILAGGYPAFVLSSHRPSRVLYARSGDAHGRSWLRRGLVVTQFACSVILLIAAAVVSLQLSYVQDQELGFDGEQLVLFQNAGAAQERSDAFRQALEQQSRVEAVSFGAPPGVGYLGLSQGMEEEDGETWAMQGVWVGPMYAETVGLTLLAGTDLEPELLTPDAKVTVINESAVQRLKLGTDPVGQTIELMEEPYRVVGVVADWHHHSLRAEVQPTALVHQPWSASTVLVRLSPGSYQEGLAQIERVWKQFVPGRPLDAVFADDRVQAQYEAEQKLGQIFGVFAVLAVFVACLGLVGLAAFTAQQRTKEIGVRKVLGASVWGITGLLSREFAVLVLTGTALAVPAAWWLMRLWLDSFAYRMSLDWWLFAGAGAVVLSVALVSVSWQAVRAAQANPVESLRYE